MESNIGDIHEDGNVNTLDLYALESYLNSNKETKIKNADLNNDGKIDINDLKILRRHINNWKGYEKLPYLGDITVYGDLDDDEKINSKDYTLILNYIQNKSVTIIEKAADVFSDGKIDDKDKYILAYYISVEEIELPQKCNDLMITYKILNEQEHIVCLRCECQEMPISEMHEFENGKCICGQIEIKDNDIKETYSDVIGTKYEEAITELSKLNITIDVEGNKFNVDEYMTRGDFAELLGKAGNYKEIAITMKNVEKFTDVQPGNMRAGYINAIADAGIMSGYPEGSFGIDDPIDYLNTPSWYIAFLGYEKQAPSTDRGKAVSLGFYDNLEYDYSEKFITRGNAMIIIWNLVNAK